MKYLDALSQLVNTYSYTIAEIQLFRICQYKKCRILYFIWNPGIWNMNHMSKGSICLRSTRDAHLTDSNPLDDSTLRTLAKRRRGLILAPPSHTGEEHAPGKLQFQQLNHQLWMG